MLSAVTVAAKPPNTTASFFLSQDHHEDKLKRGSDNWNKQKSEMRREDNYLP